MIAAGFNLYIPDTGVDHHLPKKNPVYLIHDFYHCCRLLWRDKLGQISLATTTLFWGAGATLQFIVLEWARAALDYPLSKATALQGITAIGIAGGAVAAAKFVSLRRAVDVLPAGIAMGLLVILMNFVRDLWVAIPLMVALGGLAGFFIVPMNALLQHRGHILMGAGHSIAVQNFNENLSILIMLGLYASMIKVDLSIYTIIVFFGLLRERLDGARAPPAPPQPAPGGLAAPDRHGKPGSPQAGSPVDFARGAPTSPGTTLGIDMGAIPRYLLDEGDRSAPAGPSGDGDTGLLDAYPGGDRRGRAGRARRRAPGGRTSAARAPAPGLGLGVRLHSRMA